MQHFSAFILKPSLRLAQGYSHAASTFRQRELSTVQCTLCRARCASRASMPRLLCVLCMLGMLRLQCLLCRLHLPHLLRLLRVLCLLPLPQRRALQHRQLLLQLLHRAALLRQLPIAADSWTACSCLALCVRSCRAVW